MLLDKSKQKTITIAAMIILLCLVSLSGATLALFTSESDGKIGINATSGSLKVDIIDTTPMEQSLVGETLAFITKNGDGSVKFEPGATYYTQGFRVKNNSTIPINFIIYISDDKEVSEDFYDAFDVWLTDDPTNKDGMTKIQEFDGRLEIGQCSKTLYLVFKMKESAGNEYQKQTFTGVGVTVCAVQGNGYIDID